MESSQQNTTAVSKDLIIVMMVSMMVIVIKMMVRVRMMMMGNLFNYVLEATLIDKVDENLRGQRCFCGKCGNRGRLDLDN